MAITPVVDFRAQLGPIFDQGVRLTCLAVSVSDVHAYHLQPQTLDQLSVEYLVYHASPLPKNDPLTGLRPNDVANAVAQPGQPFARNYPYSLTQTPGQPLPVPPVLAPLMCRQFSIQPFSIAAVTLALANKAGAPVIVGLQLTDNFFAPEAHADMLIDGAASDAQHGGHAVILAGRGVDSATGSDVFLVRNSWGDTWGDQGYAWLTQDYLLNHASMLMVS